MELNILHLYPEMMSLYGEYANLKVLRRHLEKLGVTANLQGVPCGETPDFDGVDMVYMGAGTERSQKAALSWLAPHRDALEAAVKGGALVLFTGNAMETLGASVTDASGKTWQGLGLADFTTVETDRRTPEDAVAKSALWDAPAVGFMNKCSTTSGVKTPLFQELSLGFGNEKERGPEGYVEGNVFATHLTGPVLVKNPAFLNLILQRLYERKGWEVPGEWPVLPHEQEAYDVTLRELQARSGRNGHV